MRRQQSTIDPNHENSQMTKEQWRNEGLALYKTNRYTEAIVAYDRAIALDGVESGTRGTRISASGGASRRPASSRDTAAGRTNPVRLTSSW